MEFSRMAAEAQTIKIGGTGAPSAKTLGEGFYPYFKSVYALTKTKSSALSEEFMAFLRSKPGRQNLVGYLDGEAHPCDTCRP
jgi:hypothetical protein